ncbi:Nif11-like leader peptide family natural product precursor [Synechococcus sp. UW179A]|uniref:Nif11-like leader peptide family natural product precursor n=1 Tax=Synechococcus sp. UW179A TaxID=2575510 RepID=UPI000E0FCD4C|nr:Nif11-like leader peptide family natural product precursor [Synechococcus sp. UW179A]
MSEEQLKAFLTKVKGDSNLQEKVKSCRDAGAMVKLAKELGFVISALEILNDFNSDSSQLSKQLSDQDTSEIYGGTGGWNNGSLGGFNNGGLSGWNNGASRGWSNGGAGEFNNA